MQRAVAVALVAACAALSGCGNSARSVGTSGDAVFAEDCSSCHSLVGNESRHKQGGDLVGYTFSRPVLLEFTREMPTRQPLSPAQLQAVVDYVLSAEHRGSRDADRRPVGGVGAHASNGVPDAGLLVK